MDARHPNVPGTCGPPALGERGVRVSLAEADSAGNAGIPSRRFDAFVFDLDGVVTDTASVHARAWQRLFNDYLRFVAERDGRPFEPFDDNDYRRYVDGRARVDGVQAFLGSRGIVLPLGGASDGPDDATAWGLANRKNELFLKALADEGVQVFPTTVTLLRRLRASGIRTAVVTASRNAPRVLGAAGVVSLFDACVDGLDAERLGLAGKPDPAVFLEAVRCLGADVVRTVVVEDAIAGVEAGRQGGFGLVIGVDRVGQRVALLEHGADLVVGDLGEIIVWADEPHSPSEPTT